MVHYDVLGVVQVAGQRHYVRARELVCTVDSFIFTICPENAILYRERETSQYMRTFNEESKTCLGLKNT